MKIAILILLAMVVFLGTQNIKLTKELREVKRISNIQLKELMRYSEFYNKLNDAYERVSK